MVEAVQEEVVKNLLVIKMVDLEDVEVMIGEKENQKIVLLIDLIEILETDNLVVLEEDVEKDNLPQHNIKPHIL